MKKILRILLITLTTIFLLLLLIPIIFRTGIERTVKQKINENVYATVDWSRFSLSMLRGFPDLSINLHHLSVVGVDNFEGDTLLGLDRFELRVNPFSAIRKEIEVSSILLNRPLINAVVLEDGSASWDIAVKTDEVKPEEEKEEEKEGGSSSMALSLEKFSIKKGRVIYHDQPMGVKAGMGDFNLDLSGDFSMAETELKLLVDIGGIDAIHGGVRYMRDGSFGLDLLAAANLEENTYSMLDNEIRINGLVLGVEGEIEMPEGGGMDLDLDFFARETSFQTLLSLVPAIYLQDFDEMEASGSLAITGKVKGVMLDSIMPDASLELVVSDGYFSYPDLPKDVSDVQIRLLASYDGADMDASTLDLDRFHLLLGGNPFDVSLHVAHPVSDMHVAGGLKGMVDFSTLADIIPLEDMNLGGRLTADLNVDTRMSYIEEERFEEVNLKGQLQIEDVLVESADVPVPVHLGNLELDFTPRYVKLADLDLKLGSSDLQMKGQLENFLPYIFEGKTVRGALAVQSGLLDANELMPASAETDTSELAGAEELPADSTVQAEAVKIPENLAFKLNLDMKEVLYEEIQVENIRGEVVLGEGVATLRELLLEVIEGTVTVSGSVDTKPDLALADLSVDMEGVDIPAAYSTFVTVEKLAPFAKFCKGSANIKLDMETALDASFSPVYESIDGKGRIFTNKLQFYNLKSFVTLSDLLKNDKFKNAAPDNLNISFTIREGKILVDPFDMKVEQSVMTVSGQHGIDMSLDYLMDMDIAKEDLGEGAMQLMSGVNALAAGAGFSIPESESVKMKARITGTFNDPKFTPDFGNGKETGKEAVKKVVEEKAREEIEKLEEDVREDVGQKAEEIMKDAEEKAAKLMAEAKKAGDALVKEAKVQGDKLVEEADSPFHKIAAREAAKELVRQAEIKSEKLQTEAQVKVDEIMDDARRRAEEL